MAGIAVARVLGSPKPRTPPVTTGATYDDFHAYMPTHAYLFGPTRELWTMASVDSRLPKRQLLDEQGQPCGSPVKASVWLDRHRPIEQMTWCPGRPAVITDHLVADGGWIPREGCSTFNLYRAPLATIGGDALQAAPWLDHVRRVYPLDADHLFVWLAQRVQHPEEKINHALVLGGIPGIGKDALLEPVKHAVGPWNFIEVTPAHIMGRFNGFSKSTILRINEAHDLGDLNRYAFYDHMKIYEAAPPDVLRVDEKNLREHAVFNVCGVIITTNHKTDGLYLAPDDRRHYVAWSDITLNDFDDLYFPALFAWYAAGGLAHVAAWLHEVDLTEFDPKAPPRKTDAWHDIVDANRAPEDAELADALDSLGYPDALTIEDLLTETTPVAFRDWLQDRRNRRQVPHRFSKCGYVAARNPYANDGLWVISRRRQVIYARQALSKDEQRQAAKDRAESV